MNAKNDIYSLLKEDHETVKSLFEKLEATTSRAKKAREQLFSEIKTELTLHSKAESETFYARLLAEKDAKDEILEATEEHEVVTRLLADISSVAVDDERWMAKCTVLKEIMLHHVKEEEGEIFKAAKRILEKNEAIEIGTQFTELKNELKNQDLKESRQTMKLKQNDVEASA